MANWSTKLPPPICSSLSMTAVRKTLIWITKRDGYGRTDNDKRELLKDVVGFANASGGVILIGVAEDKSNIAIDIPGIDPDPNQKDLMERYERTIRSGIEPRLVGVSIQSIAVAGGKVVIAIGVPQSLLRPHRVKAVGSERWTVRHNRDTIDMTYAEIRSAFLDTANMQKRVTEFQDNRCRSIRGGIRAGERGILVIHVIPLATEGRTLEVRAALRLRANFFPPGWQDQVPLKSNFDGVRAESYVRDQGHWWGWVQLYRNGNVEGVAGNYVALEGQEGDQGPRLILIEGQLEADTFTSVAAYLRGIAELGFNPPYAVAISLLNAADSQSRLLPSPRSQFEVPPTALFEPVIMESASLTGAWHSLLQPIFDQLWNCYGHTACTSFNPQGVWRGAKATT
jgi:hypothetical protein